MSVLVIISPKGKFPLGEIVITANASRQLSSESVSDALKRHVSGDWGDVPASDAALNDDALKHGDRLLSAYVSNGTRFWIITEWDRSVTTVLLPEDY